MRFRPQKDVYEGYGYPSATVSDSYSPFKQQNSYLQSSSVPDSYLPVKQANNYPLFKGHRSNDDEEPKLDSTQSSIE